ncbi:F0F1 ATP synthase subunit A [Leptospira ryugenii]|uniref:ATP synthase subunit a n=1 Tax=Leptospira ryugenii TaxID=1917863 RepID=A0A2P2E100_9LEPT|nr:F0F1 ATP synthase subunit A [Leptospira ryugenii]GBF50563.1 F0F1 ATP synthase subunit A [Leptospira ryugenii]
MEKNNKYRHFFTFSLIFFLTFTQVNASGHEPSDSEAFDFSEVMSHHLGDAPIFPLNFGGKKVFEGQEGFNAEEHDVFRSEEGKAYHFVGGFDMHITKRVTMMWIASFFLFLVFIPAAQMISRDPRKVANKFTSGVEAFVSYLKENVVDASLDHHGHSYYHYIFSLFFFILFCNLFGLIPSVGELSVAFSDALVSIGVLGHTPHFLHTFGEVWSGITPTGDIGVTLALASLTLLIIYVTAFAYQGISFVGHAVPKGVPLLLWPLMWILEFIVTHIARSFALTMRLLANMTAGHVMILALLGFIFMSQNLFIAPISVLSSVMIYFLELLVAFLQAFIFSLLTTVFIGTVMHRH